MTLKVGSARVGFGSLPKQGRGAGAGGGSRRFGRLARRAVGAVIEMLEPRQLLSGTYNVTTNVGMGTGTLYDAITQANAGTYSEIDFHLPANQQTISLTTPLPGITAPVTINGASEAAFLDSSTTTPLIVIANGGEVSTGITLSSTLSPASSSSGSTISDLDFTGFTSAAIDVQTDGNTISGNFIGTDTTGAAAGPGNLVGIRVTGTNNTISGNTIAFNTNAIQITIGTGNVMTQNSIFHNTNAIVLVSGGNDSLNAPVLTAATSTNGLTTVDGTFTAPAAGTYTIEFFASKAGDPATGGQAHVFLGSTVLNAVSGVNSFEAALATPTAVAIGQRIIATATRQSNGDTSPLAAAQSVVDPFIVTNTNDSGVGSLRQAILNANANPGADTITFGLTGGGPYVVALSSALPTITDAVTINGFSENSFLHSSATTPLVMIANGGAVPDGLVLTSSSSPASSSSGSTIEGLDFTGFTGSAIDVQTDGNTITGNFIGSDTTGAAAGPGNSVGINVTSSNNTISSNVIAFNTNAIQVSSGNGDDFTQNSIFHNTNAIILTNGANNGITPPVLTSATQAGGITTIHYQYNASEAGDTLEFFASAPGDPASPGQAHIFLGVAPMDASGVAILTSAPAVPFGQVITATVTDGTSELSAGVKLLPEVGFSVPTETVDESAGTFSITVALNAVSNMDTTIPFTLSGTAVNGTDYSGVSSPLVIPAGHTSGTITGNLLDDPGNPTTLTFQLGTPTNATLAYPVDQRNAPPLDVTVNTLTITQPNPSPTLTMISPTSVTVGGADTPIVATGSGFIGSSIVEFNGVPLATTFVNSMTLDATIPAADLTAAGPQSITVFTPGPGGGDSSPQTFTVNPAATTTAISSSANPAVYGQDITYTAAVTNTSGTGGVPAGAVQFVVDGVNLGLPVVLDASGQTVSSPVVFLSGTSHNVEAVYLPSPNFTSGGPVSLNQTVQQIAVEGNELFIGSNGPLSADQVQINPIGTSKTGSTGVQIQVQLNGVKTTTQYNMAFSGVEITLQNGNDQVQLNASLTLSAVVSAGNGNDSVQLGNSNNNVVTLGNGNDNVQIGAGSNESVIVGNGNDNIQIGAGSNDSVIAGNGNDNIQLGAGSKQSVTVGNGTDNIQLGAGSFDDITLGSGHDNVQIGDGSNNTVFGLILNPKDTIKFGKGTNNIIS